ncbi:MAG: hypothetical protein E7678_03150 [Ruminococcaceae bacterium]|nr:hypothetical protein [Oscillospiraceae bacterium]
MKKTKIFQETFSDILKPQGFVFKNKTFIRVVGENIVQSLFLEATSPSYAFEMNLAPAATLTIPRGRIFFELMKREFRGKYNLSFNNFSEFPYVSSGGDYYRFALKNPEDEKISNSPIAYIEGKEVEKTIANFQKAAEVFERDYLPILNATTDFESYLKFRENCFKDESLFSGRVKPPLNHLELSYKAYLDGNSKYGVEYLRNVTKEKFLSILKNRFFDWELYDFETYYEYVGKEDEEDAEKFGFPENLIRRFSPSFVEKNLASVQNAVNNPDSYEQMLYEPFWERIYSNDFSDIPQQWADEERFVLDLIKETFPKIILPQC